MTTREIPLLTWRVSEAHPFIRLMDFGGLRRARKDHPKLFFFIRIRRWVTAGKGMLSSEPRAVESRADLAALEGEHSAVQILHFY
jgi:hypothetical protein